MDLMKNEGKDLYQIRLKEALNPSLTGWLGEITIIPQDDGNTLLIGAFADQPALRGLLDQLWNFNFTILSVERVEEQDDFDLQQEQEESG